MLTRRRPGFTLIELLVVIAIIGLLATALVPAVKAVKMAARKAQAKSVFAQWATACTLYKKEYGAYLPNLGSDYKTASDILHNLDDSDPSMRFIKCLYGKNPNGTALVSAERVRFNRQAMEFCAFSQDDFYIGPTEAPSAWQAKPFLQDRLGNTGIRVCFDLNNDGLLKSLPGALPAKMPDGLEDAAGSVGVPGRVLIFTTDRDVGISNKEITPSEAADIYVIQ
jgi:prepilin-type N-terminal cleavage/methylation domain-containing protein